MSWVAVGVGVVGAGVGAYGASQQPGQQKPEPERDTRHNINAFLSGAPTQFGLEQLYGSLYGQLGLRQTDAYLFGRPTETLRGRVPYVNKDGKLSYRGYSLKRPGTEGLFGLMERAQPQVESMYFGNQLEGRNSLLDSLSTQAQEDLSLGYSLSPSLRRELEQASLGDASLRGFGRSPLDAYMTYASLGSAAEARRRERQSFATGVAGLLAQPRPEATTTAQLLGAGTTLSSQTGPRLFNPFQQFAAGPTPGAAGQANSMMALGGGLLGAAGQIGGAQYANRGVGQGGYTNIQPSYSGSPWGWGG